MHHAPNAVAVSVACSLLVSNPFAICQRRFAVRLPLPGDVGAIHLRLAGEVGLLRDYLQQLATRRSKRCRERCALKVRGAVKHLFSEAFFDCE